MDDDGALQGGESQGQLRLSISTTTITIITYTDDAVLAKESHLDVPHRTLGLAIRVDLDVSEIANVAVRVLRGTVLLIERIDYRERRD